MGYAINVVTINGSRKLYGYGAVALVNLDASGYNSHQKYGVSAAALSVLNGSGAMKKALGGSGSASVSVGAGGVLKQAAPGRGVAALISLTFRYGIPRPKYIPPGVTTGHPNRDIRVPADGRIVDISPEGES